MRYLLSFLMLALVAASLPSPALAAGEDLFGDEVYSNTPQVFMPTYALGAPDGKYADFFKKDEQMVIDMGTGEEGVGDLIMHFTLQQFGAEYLVTFLDADLNQLDFYGRILPINKSEEPVPYEGTEPYRYVRIQSTNGELLRVDAVEASDYYMPEEEEEEMTEEGEEEEEEMMDEEDEAPRGLLVTLPDDGNELTHHDEAVYVIGPNGKRHAFPNLHVYNSWWEDFDDVAFINDTGLASYPLGLNVTVRPGTFLVKLANNPKTYAVEPGGVLRHITSETVAVQLYGENWADRVIDMSDVFFNNYTVGEPITTAIHPDGTLGVLPSGELVYITGEKYYSLPGDVKASMRFNSDFAAPVSASLEQFYTDGGSLEVIENLQFPF